MESEQTFLNRLKLLTASLRAAHVHDFNSDLK